MRSAPEQTTPTGTQDVEMESAGSPDHHPSLANMTRTISILSHPDAPPSRRRPGQRLVKEVEDLNHDQALLKGKKALWRLFLSQCYNRADRLRNMYRDQYMKSSLKSVTAPWRSFIRPELIVEPSVPSYPVDNLPFVPRVPIVSVKLRPWNDVNQGVRLGCLLHSTTRTTLQTTTEKSGRHKSRQT
ncbi:hypothetical protein GQ600_15095 [Phytophthora cactorum]|nr:hypothetical protein GQ600_15095 [Phytophthora cactorum]